MTEKQNSKVFIRAGEPVGIIGGKDSRYCRTDDAFVVCPDERWGNPLYADACLEENDFHIHARLTLDRLIGTGVSLLLGGHYHYNWSRPEGNLTLRICLDEDRIPTRRAGIMTAGKEMLIVHGRTEPRKPWCVADDSTEKEFVGACSDYFRAGEPFDVDIYRRQGDLSFEINGKEVFRTCLDDESRISRGRNEHGWPINFGFLPGRGMVKIHEFWAEGSFAEPTRPTTDVWQQNSEGYSHYRIPALCTTPGGRLLAFAEARRTYLSRGWEWNDSRGREIGASEIHCVMKTSEDDGLTWSDQKILIDRGASYEARDPSPLVDEETGEIFLFTRGPWVISSKDEGQSWSAPRSLAPALPGDWNSLTPGTANCAVRLRHGRRQGRLLVALYTKSVIGLIFSDDHGRTWQPGALFASYGACEPAIVELSDGRVIVNARQHSDQIGRLILVSNDGGTTFDEKRYDPELPTAEPGNRCQSSLMALESSDAGSTGSERPIIFCGPTEGRTRLTLKVSLDDCATWPVSKVLDNGSAAYSALTARPGGQVGVLYERDKYRRLSFQRFDLKSLING